MVRAAQTSPSDKKPRILADGMEVDSKAEDSSWETQSELTTSNSKVLIDADVLSKITATLERLTLQVEKMQARVEETGLQGKQINRGVQPKTRSGRRGVVRTEELNIFKEAVRDHACKCLGLERDQDPSDWPTADPDQVKDYNRKNPSKFCIGPDNECLRMDWGSKGVTNWTRDCASILASDMCVRKTNGGFSWVRYPFTEGEVANAFKIYIRPLKRKYQREVDDPMFAAEHQEAAKKRSRSFSRRKQLLGRRLALMKHHNFPKAAVDLVESLDMEGVSSEESEGEIGEHRIYKVKALPWRNPQLTAWLHRIDTLPTKNSLGAVMSKRVTHRCRQGSDLVSEERPPVPDLHRNMYEPNWLQKRPARFAKQLCVDSEFTLPALDPYSC